MAANPLRTRRMNMSKKTSTKTTRPAKTTKKAKAPKAKPEPKVVAPGECPKGGSHEWTEDESENFCSKCKEPRGAKAKQAKGTKKAAKPAKDKKVSALDAAAQVLQS